VLWLSEGDAPTKFFHVQASARHRSKFIRSLEHDGQILVSEDCKAATVFDFYDSIMGTPLALTALSPWRIWIFHGWTCVIFVIASPRQKFGMR
jgi:hypothetical protein